MSKPAPDFAIVGAPKCGTTALFATLQSHPGLALSKIKEPRFFAADFPHRREADDEAAYDALFAHAAEGQLRGEASSIYLASRVAIPALLQRRPDAKLIALVRNPLEMFISWHNECLKSLDEDEPDPEKAWRLQGERKAGRTPKLCIEPEYLAYRDICALGTQIERFFHLVPPEQRLVIVWNDLDRHPALVHNKLVHFLGIDNIQSTEFLRENVFGTHKHAIVPWMIRAFYARPVLRRLRRRLKPFLNDRGYFPLSWAVKNSLQRVPKPVLSEAFLQELQQAFDPEIDLLEKLLKRDFTEWRLPGGRPGSLRRSAGR